MAADAVPDEVRVIVRDELAHNGFPMDASAFVCRRHAIGGWVFAFASLEADHVIFLMVYALDDLPELQRHVTLRPLVGRAKQRLSG